MLIIGGTRYVGRELVARRLARGDEITVVSRGSERPAWINEVVHICCDRENIANCQSQFAP